MYRRMHIVQILIFTFAFSTVCSQANALPFLSKRAEGWFWYEDKAKKEQKNRIKEQAKQVPDEATPTEIIESNKKELEATLHKAILEPSYDNVKSYMALQKEMMSRSEAFSTRWQEVVYKEPTLNEEVNYPTSHSAMPIHYEAQKQAKEQKLKAIAKDFGLLYFFKSDCPYCQKFSGLAKSFAEKYGFEILGISADGNVNKEFPEAVADNGVSRKLDINSYPTLVAVNERTKEMIPITYGYVSLSDLEDTLYFLSTVKDDKK